MNPQQSMDKSAQSEDTVKTFKGVPRETDQPLYGDVVESHQTTGQSAQSQDTAKTSWPTFKGLPLKTGQTLYGEPIKPNIVHSDGEEFVRNLRAMAMRKEDILLLAYPKCGTHWVVEIIQMLRKGRAEIDERTKEHMMLEFGTPAVFDQEPSPRLLNSHLPIAFLPVQTFKDKIKIVHIYRNPKDTVISFFHHNRCTYSDDNFDFDDFLDVYIDNTILYGHQFHYLHQLSRFFKQNPDYPIIHVQYEDLSKNPFQVVKQLVAFLDLKTSDDFIHQVIEACDFTKMKEADDKRYNPDQLVKSLGRKKVNIYRKGRAGGWKNFLTVAQNERLDAFIAKESKGLDFQFIYQFE